MDGIIGMHHVRMHDSDIMQELLTQAILARAREQFLFGYEYNQCPMTSQAALEQAGLEEVALRCSCY